MILTGAISNPSNSNCYQCHTDTSEKCDIHFSTESYEPYVNYLCSLREIDTHGEFYVNYVTEDTGKENIQEKIHERYDPCKNCPTSDKVKIGYFSRPVAKRTKHYVENFKPERKNALEVLMQEILLDATYENVVCIIQSELMNYVLKTLSTYKQKLPILKRGSNNNVKSIHLEWVNFKFVTMESYVSDYENFAGLSPVYFPMVMNIPQFFVTPDGPSLSHYFNLSDTKSERLKKECYYKTLNKEIFIFDIEMRNYLMCMSKNLLKACVKLQNVTFKIQDFLKNSYPEKTQDIGSIYRMPSTNAFFYYLIVTYCVYDLEEPILSLRLGETGVYSSHCSKPEFEFQKFLRHKRYIHK